MYPKTRNLQIYLFILPQPPKKQYINFLKMTRRINKKQTRKTYVFFSCKTARGLFFPKLKLDNEDLPRSFRLAIG